MVEKCHRKGLKQITFVYILVSCLKFLHVLEPQLRFAITIDHVPPLVAKLVLHTISLCFVSASGEVFVSSSFPSYPLVMITDSEGVIIYWVLFKNAGSQYL